MYIKSYHIVIYLTLICWGMCAHRSARTRTRTHIHGTQSDMAKMSLMFQAAQKKYSTQHSRPCMKRVSASPAESLTVKTSNRNCWIHNTGSMAWMARMEWPGQSPKVSNPPEIIIKPVMGIQTFFSLSFFFFLVITGQHNQPILEREIWEHCNFYWAVSEYWILNFKCK